MSFSVAHVTAASKSVKPRTVTSEISASASIARATAQAAATCTGTTTAHRMDRPSHAMIRQVKKRTLRNVFLAAGVALFAYLVVRLGPGALLEMLGRIGWNAVPIAIIYTGYQSLRAFALTAAVTGARTIRWRDAFWIRVSGEAVQLLTSTGPFIAEPAKVWLLKRRGLSTEEGFAATLTEYLAYTFVAAAFSIVALGWMLAQGILNGVWRGIAVGLVVAMGAFLAAAAVAIGLRVHLLGAILEWIARLPGVRTRLRPDMPGVHRTEDLLLGILHDRPGRFAKLVLVDVGSHTLHLLELYWITRALALPATLWTAFLIEGATKFIGLAFFFVPGQVGASETAHTVVFELLGLPAVAGLTVAIVRRIRLIGVAGVGLLAMSLLTRDRIAERG